MTSTYRRRSNFVSKRRSLTSLITRITKHSMVCGTSRNKFSYDYIHLNHHWWGKVEPHISEQPRVGSLESGSTCSPPEIMLVGRNVPVCLPLPWCHNPEPWQEVSQSISLCPPSSPTPKSLNIANLFWNQQSRQMITFRSSFVSAGRQNVRGKNPNWMVEFFMFADRVRFPTSILPCLSINLW